MLTLHGLLTSAAILVAVVVWAKARRLARRLERLTESYWELRYEHGQLRARLNRLDPEPSSAASASGDARPGGTTTAFVPLSTLKSVVSHGSAVASRETAALSQESAVANPQVSVREP